MEKMRLIVILTIIIIGCCLFPRGVSAQSSSENILSSQGSIIYPESPTPTPTPSPTPTPTPSPINLAVIPDDWSLTYGGGPQIIHLDYSVTHNGQVAIRLDPHVDGVDVNTARECDGTWYTVKPGDHIVAKCWIRTDSAAYQGSYPEYCGARIGVDLYAPKGDGTIRPVDSYPHDGQEHIDSMVNWGTTVWTQKTWDFTIPTTVYTKSTSGEPITATQVTHIVMWIQALPTTFVGKAWFADAELYINP